MTLYILKHVQNPEQNTAIYRTIRHGRMVYDFRRDGILWSSPTGIYVGIGGMDDVLLQLQSDKGGLVICSRHDGVPLKARAHERLVELGITPEQIIAAGLQHVRQEFKDGVRRSLDAFVSKYFLNGSQAKPA